MAGQPKVPFYLAVAAVVLGLIGFAIYRADLLAPKGKQDQPNEVIDLKKLGGGGNETPVAASAVEAHDDASVTTVKEYAFKPSEKLPPVKGIAAYKPMADNTVRFALNVWAGWAPIIHANNGFKPEKVWKAPGGKDFKVELVLIDNPIEMRDAFAAGDVHIGWATLDMLPLIVDGFVDSSGNPKDSRVMPRVFQQIDWSNGGDGIVVRDNIKTNRNKTTRSRKKKTAELTRTSRMAKVTRTKQARRSRASNH